MVKAVMMKVRTSAIVILLALSNGLWVFTGAQPSPEREVATAKIDDVSVSIDYGRLEMKDRKIFGGLVPYGELWRTGANQPTTIEIDDDLLVNGALLPKGKYNLLTIPGADRWSLIFYVSKDASWGAYEDSEPELVVEASSGSSDAVYEQFTIELNDEGSGALAWERSITHFELARPGEDFVHRFDMRESVHDRYGTLSITIDPRDSGPELHINGEYKGILSKHKNEILLPADKECEIKLMLANVSYCLEKVTVPGGKRRTKECDLTDGE